MTKQTEEMLEGIRVIDFTTMMSGPYCTRLMADIGAEVIKIESATGDHIRTRPPFLGDHSTYFGQLNAGKKSLALDLKKPAAIEIVRGLTQSSNVIVENFRPGVMHRLGLDYETLSSLNPHLVYCSISGFGQSGKWADRSAYAPILHAASGYDMANLKYQDNLERPLKNGIFVADVLGGSLAFGAIQAALFRAERTGRGENVDLSLFESMLGLLVYESQEAQIPSEQRRPLYRPTQARDGFIVIAPTSQSNFEMMSRAVGHPEWIADNRFAGGGNRENNWDILMDLLDDWAASRSAEDCEKILSATGVPCSRYYTIAEAMNLPPVQDRGVLETVSTEEGKFKVTNPAFRFASCHAHARQHIPRLGEDGESILRQLLGHDSSAIELLKEKKVLFTPPPR